MYKSSSITDEEIISQCKTGSLKYQELLYKRFYGFAMGVARRYALNADDALETVNDAFIKVFNSIKGFETGKPFKAWLRTVTVNAAIDRRRKELKFLVNDNIESAYILNIPALTIDALNAKDILLMLQSLPVMHATVFNLIRDRWVQP